jgi:hypothetical protein
MTLPIYDEVESKKAKQKFTKIISIVTPVIYVAAYILLVCTLGPYELHLWRSVIALLLMILFSIPGYYTVWHYLYISCNFVILIVVSMCPSTILFVVVNILYAINAWCVVMVINSSIKVAIWNQMRKKVDFSLV